MAVNGTGSLVILVIVLLGALALQAQVEGKPQDNFIRDKDDNVSRIIDYSSTKSMKPKLAKPKQFPWMVSLDIFEETSGSNCGGSIIDRKWIMSAAHCITTVIKDVNGNAIGYKIIAKSITIFAGITDRIDYGKNMETRLFEEPDIKAVGENKLVFIHKDYNKGLSFANDIVLFKLKKHLRINEYVKPIALAIDEDSTNVKFLIVSGWGRMGISGTSIEGCKDSFKKCITDDKPFPWCDTEDGKGKYCDDTSGCEFPFIYENIEYSVCTTKNSEKRPWCSTKTYKNHKHKPGHVKYCDEYTKSTEELRYVTKLKLKSQQECASKWALFKDTMICHYTKDKTTSVGDSGGPVIFKIQKGNPPIYIQIGIVSSIFPLYEYAAIFTNVAKMRPWIFSTMGYISGEYPNGFFRSSGLWYRLFKGEHERVTWEEARSKCHSFGMRLAEPRDDMAAKALQIDTLDKFGGFSAAWIGAQGDGNNFEFKVSGLIVPHASPLIDTHSIAFYDPTDENCLVLNGVKTEDPPYEIHQISSIEYPLCEDIPGEYLNGFFLSSGLWYRLFKGEHDQVTWEEARSKCHSFGMRLAEPRDVMAAKALQKDTLDKFDEFSYAWIGAQGDGEKFVFEMSGHIVPHNSALLDAISPGLLEPTDGNYLVLNGVKTEDPPYEIRPNWKIQYPLCEDSPYNSSIDGESTYCPNDGDFFTLTVGGPKQCFKVIEQLATWEEANEDCKALKLVLAQPYAPVQLRSYIVQKYGGDFNVWLGACQDEGQMTWTEGNEEITKEDPLWYTGQPDHPEGCLLLLSTKLYFEDKPGKPYWNVLSSFKFYPLCELVLA